MIQTIGQIPHPLHDSLPPLRASPKKNELMGFRLGTAFTTHEKAFSDLAEQGFNKPPAFTGKLFQRFMLDRKTEGVAAAIELSLTFEYEEERLTRIGLVIARDAREGEKPIEVLRAFEGALVQALGKPHLVLDRTMDWKRQSIHTQDPSLAYAIFWSGSEAVPPQAVQTTESFRFFDALIALGHDGALATITGVLGNVIGSVDFFQGQPGPATSGQFLSFIKNR